MRSRTANYYKLIETYRNQKFYEVRLLGLRPHTDLPTHRRFCCQYFGRMCTPAVVKYLHMYICICVCVCIYVCGCLCIISCRCPNTSLSYRFIRTHLFCVSYQQSAQRLALRFSYRTLFMHFNTLVAKINQLVCFSIWSDVEFAKAFSTSRPVSNNRRHWRLQLIPAKSGGRSSNPQKRFTQPTIGVGCNCC